MNRILHIVANGLSAVFYPLLIPTYGMILFCITLSHPTPLLFTSWLVVVGGTLLLTGLLPISLILYQVHRGDIQDIYIQHKEERTLAYIETIGGFACWWYLLQFALHAPAWLCGVALGGTIAIAAVAVINRWWKISAHLTGMGGLLGGLITYYLFAASPTVQAVPYGLVYIALGLTLLVMYARLYLNAHTPWQVIAGLALGLGCTLLTPLCYV